MQYGPYASHVAEFADLLKAGAKVVDIGCGPGNTAKQLCELKQVELVGIDLSQAMVEAARLSAPSATFLLQDVRSADFEPRSFDAAILSFCIVHLKAKEAEELIVKAVKWLRPGGLIYLSFMEGKQPGLETTSFSAQPIYFNYFPGDEMEAILSRNGTECFRSVRQDYPETDGSITTDVFIFARKL